MALISSDIRSIWIGFDPRPLEVEAFVVARNSIKQRLSKDIPINALNLPALKAAGLYWRQTERRNGQLWDTISDAPMSTAFAISRFLVPYLAGKGLALFVDCDVMALADLNELFDLFDPKYVCMCVKHDYTPKADTKMDGKTQLPYKRKNWSSVVLWNCEHEKAKFLTPEVVNTSRGLSLHQFAWLEDSDIGALDPCWNHLVGDTPPNSAAKLVHFTNGTPNMPGKVDCEFAREWWDEWRATGRELF